MTERKPLSPLAERIYASCEAHVRAYPRWGWTETDYLAGEIKQLRQEIAAAKPKRKRGPNTRTIINETLKQDGMVRMGGMTIMRKDAAGDPVETVNGTAQNDMADDLRDLI